MLLKGAYCVGKHFVDPQCTDTFITWAMHSLTPPKIQRSFRENAFEINIEKVFEKTVQHY